MEHTVLLTNKPTEHNKKLLDFFNKSLDQLNRKKIYIKWVIVYKSEKENYERQHITKYPVLIPHGCSDHTKYIVGSTSIINHLSASPQTARPQPSAEFDWNEHLMKMAQEPEQPAGDDVLDQATIQFKMLEAQNVRKANEQHIPEPVGGYIPKVELSDIDYGAPAKPTAIETIRSKKAMAPPGPGMQLTSEDDMLNCLMDNMEDSGDY